MNDRILRTGEKTVINVKYHFSDFELQELGEQAAHHHRQRGILEREKKMAMDDYKDRFEGLDDKINDCSTKILDRYEIRPTSCDLILNFSTDQREYYHHGVIVHTEPLKEDDYRLSLQFKADQQAREAEEAEAQKDEIA